MINIIKTRLMHISKSWLSLLFWLIFPSLITLIIISLTSTIQDDVKIPIGVVLEEETLLAIELFQSIADSPLLRVNKLTEDEAIDQLYKQKLDSVFIIQAGYENNIQDNNRNRLIYSYQSDLSFGYIPVSEMIISYVQQDINRSKAVHTVTDLFEEYDQKNNVSRNDIINKSKLIQAEQNLINSTFIFYNTQDKQNKDQKNLINPWHLWSVFALLSTLLIFDWVIKERRSQAAVRFVFMRVSLKAYLFRNFIIYTIILSLLDMITLITFNMVLGENASLSFLLTLLSYRLVITMLVFLFTLIFRNLYIYYASAFILTLLTAILSGALIPIDGIISYFPWINYVNPLKSFLSGEIFNIWLIYLSILMGIWYVKRG